MTCVTENHKRRVEARVQTLLEAVDDTPLGKVGSCDMQKLIKLLKLRKARGIDGISNECLRYLPKRPLVHSTHLFNQCFWFSNFSKVIEERKCHKLTRPGKDPEFSQTLLPISLSSTTGKLFSPPLRPPHF
jgi:hypothetical protein